MILITIRNPQTPHQYPYSVGRYIIFVEWQKERYHTKSVSDIHPLDPIVTGKSIASSARIGVPKYIVQRDP